MVVREGFSQSPAFVSETFCTFAAMKRLLTYIIIVLVLSACTTKADHARMRSGLDSINVLNRNSQPFTIADVQPYVQFFDDHGTANDRLLAHYLLGRAYHEAGEAPMALECYQHALDCADTTAANCNYAQLSRGYAQMSRIFYEQGLYREQLNSTKITVDYAWRGGDTLAALMSYEQEGFAYEALGLIDSAIYVIEDVAKLYTQLGLSSDAAITLGAIVHAIIDKKEYATAQKYLNKYEAESGFFDENGNIAKGREFYYYLKGSLCMGLSQLDSAEYWFRKELNNGMDFTNQNGGALGLARVYEILHKPDSAEKYYRYAYSMNDSVYSHMTTETIKQKQAMYDYSRHQEIARRESDRANRIAHTLWIGLGILAAFTLLVFNVFYYINRKRKDAIRDYKNSLTQMERAQYTIARLQSMDADNRNLIADNNRIIEDLKVKIRDFEQNAGKKDRLRQEQLLRDSDEYKLFLDYSRKARIPSDEDWQKVHIRLYELFPDFHQLLIVKMHLLNQNEFNACFLVRMHFKPADLMNMLNISSAYANKIRKSLLQKLFDTDGKAENFDEEIANLF